MIQLSMFNPPSIIILLLFLVVILLHFFFGWLTSRVAQKLGHNNTWISYLPLFQQVMHLRLGSISSWWILALLIPYAGLLVFIFFYIKALMRISERVGQKKSFCLSLLSPVLYLWSWYKAGTPAPPHNQDALNEEEKGLIKTINTLIKQQKTREEILTLMHQAQIPDNKSEIILQKAIEPISDTSQWGLGKNILFFVFGLILSVIISYAYASLFIFPVYRAAVNKYVSLNFVNQANLILKGDQFSEDRQDFSYGISSGVKLNEKINTVFEEYGYSYTSNLSEVYYGIRFTNKPYGSISEFIIFSCIDPKDIIVRGYLSDTEEDIVAKKACKNTPVSHPDLTIIQLGNNTEEFNKDIEFKSSKKTHITEQKKNPIRFSSEIRKLSQSISNGTFSDILSSENGIGSIDNDFYTKNFPNTSYSVREIHGIKEINPKTELWSISHDDTNILQYKISFLTQGDTTSYQITPVDIEEKENISSKTSKPLKENTINNNQPKPKPALSTQN